MTTVEYAYAYKNMPKWFATNVSTHERMHTYARTAMHTCTHTHTRVYICVHSLSHAHMYIALFRLPLSRSRFMCTSVCLSLTHTQVAVKMALPNMLVGAKQNTNVKSAYQKEICLLCRLEHPNIVSCYGMITHDDDGELLMWCVMEKLDVDLFKAVTTGQLQMGKDNAPLFVSLLGSFVSALAYLHSPVSHRLHLFTIFSMLCQRCQ